MNVGILDYHQKATDSATTFIEEEIALLLVARLAAEPITRKKIRIFPPTSAFLALKPSQIHSNRNCGYIPETLPSGEVSGCVFRLPNSPQWRETHLQARNYVSSMARLMTMSGSHSGNKINEETTV